MQIIDYILLIFCVGVVASVPVFQVSVFSSLKTEIQRGQIKDFIGCEEKKTILIEEECHTTGDTKHKICQGFKKKLEKLDCKDKCKDFYKKYNKFQIEKAEEQKKFYKKQKDKENLEESTEELEDLKENEEAFIELQCAGDVNEIEESISETLEEEK